VSFMPGCQVCARAACQRRGVHAPTVRMDGLHDADVDRQPTNRHHPMIMTDVIKLRYRPALWKSHNISFNVCHTAPRKPGGVVTRVAELKVQPRPQIEVQERQNPESLVQLNHESQLAGGIK